MLTIDKKTMEIIRELEAQLQSFHGFRHLWAELVANHEPCGVSKEKLEAQQSDRLTAALGQAYTLAAKHNIVWSDCSSKLRNFVQELADLDCTYKDNCPDFGSRHGKCIRCQAKEALKI
jgi:hypothetical protein